MQKCTYNTADIVLYIHVQINDASYTVCNCSGCRGVARPGHTRAAARASAHFARASAFNIFSVKNGVKHDSYLLEHNEA